MVNLNKRGQKVSLTKEAPSMVRMLVGLGWKVNKYDGGSDFDLDGSAFLGNDSGRCRDENDFVFYGNPMHPSGAVYSDGDNKEGNDGSGDAEQIHVDLSKVEPGITKISFSVTIYDADKRNQTFGQISDAYIRIVNEDTGEQILRYDLGEDFSIETAIVAAEIYKHGSEWKFNSVGAGFEGGLAAICKNFGIDAE